MADIASTTNAAYQFNPYRGAVTPESTERAEFGAPSEAELEAEAQGERTGQSENTSNQGGEAQNRDRINVYA